MTGLGGFDWLTDTKALFALAENYTELGRHDEALTALEKCIEFHEGRMMWLKGEPRLALLKGKARFDEILRRFTLPPTSQSWLEGEENCMGSFC
jgi:hypothetical protein